MPQPCFAGLGEIASLYNRSTRRGYIAGAIYMPQPCFAGLGEIASLYNRSRRTQKKTEDSSVEEEGDI